jgi:hypothetical protein
MTLVIRMKPNSSNKLKLYSNISVRKYYEKECNKLCVEQEHRKICDKKNKK